MKLSKNQQKEIRYFLEYAVTVPFLLLLKCFSIKKRIQLGRIIGRFVMYPILKFFIKKRYNAIRKNLKIVLKRDIPPKEEKALIKDYCANTVKIFIEGFSQEEMDKKWIENNVTAENSEYLVDLYQQKKKIIIVSIHMGAWEIAHKYSYKLYGIHHTILFRKQNNKRLDDMYCRTRTHVDLIEKRDKNALRKMIHFLNDGKVIVVLLDQKDLHHGEVIKFCGEETKFPTAISRLAIKNNVYLVPLYCYRANGGKYLIKIEKPILPSPEDTPHKITQELFSIFETWVIKYPTQWFCLIQDIWYKNK